MNSNSSFRDLPSLICQPSLFCALGIVGDSLVLIAVYRTMELRTLSNLYLVALAIADFVTSAIAQPGLIAVVVQQSKGKCNKTLEKWQEHCTGIARGVGSIPAGGPIVDEFFSTVSGLNLDMCTIFHSK